DRTPPAALSLALVDGSPTDNTSVPITVGGCSGDAVQMLFQLEGAAPSGGDARWEACSATKSFALTGPDGEYRIHAFAKDTVGNISAASSSITVLLDRA